MKQELQALQVILEFVDAAVKKGGCSLADAVNANNAIQVVGMTLTSLDKEGKASE